MFFILVAHFTRAYTLGIMELNRYAKHLRSIKVNVTLWKIDGSKLANLEPSVFTRQRGRRSTETGRFFYCFIIRSGRNASLRKCRQMSFANYDLIIDWFGLKLQVQNKKSSFPWFSLVFALKVWEATWKKLVGRI